MLARQAEEVGVEILVAVLVLKHRNRIAAGSKALDCQRGTRLDRGGLGPARAGVFSQSPALL